MGLDMAELTQRLGAGDFRGFALPGVTLSVETAETIDTLRTHNLLAKIPGTKRPNETIIY